MINCADNLMKGAPVHESRQVTLANWRSSPFNLWAFHHVREIVPTADIRCGTSRSLKTDAGLLSDIAFEDDTGTERVVRDVFGGSWTTGLVVLRSGKIVTETWDHGYSGIDPHIVFSISKSITSLVAGALADRGQLDPDAFVTRYIPEAEGSAYGDCSVRHLLDMTVSCTFEEIYLEPEGDYAQYRAATGWNPPLTKASAGMRAFLLSLQRDAHDHGEVFTYLSPNSDMLGWVIERASGVRFSDLMSDVLWQPMGAEHSASITVDAFGAPRTAGGISVHIRDLARLGEMMRCGGVVNGTQVVPKWWIEDTLGVTNGPAWQRGEMKSLFPNGGYRNKWYQTGNPSGAFCAIGIHGQWLYIDPQAEVVIARTAAQREPVDEPLDLLHIAAFDAIARHLEKL